MSVLEKLRMVSYCHLPPITLSVSHIPIDPSAFPATGKEFTNYSAVSKVHLFGASFAFMNVSGLTRTEVEASLKSDDRVHGIRLQMVRFLQALEWIHTGNYEQKFEFVQIVAYLENGQCVVAKPTDCGFESIPYIGDEVPWIEGTLLLFVPDGL
jgi:hypothetical protein